MSTLNTRVCWTFIRNQNQTRSHHHTTTQSHPHKERVRGWKEGESSEWESHHSQCSVVRGERGWRVGTKKWPTPPPPLHPTHPHATPPTHMHKAPSTQDERWCGERERLAHGVQGVRERRLSSNRLKPQSHAPPHPPLSPQMPIRTASVVRANSEVATCATRQNNGHPP